MLWGGYTRVHKMALHLESSHCGRRAMKFVERVF